jgi:transcriptional regulator with XRE-family HTH domain
MAMRRRPQPRLGAKLFALRRGSYLSREQVARNAGISAHLLQSLEQGRKANPTVQPLLGLAHALRVPVIELIDCIVVELSEEEQVNSDLA